MKSINKHPIGSVSEYMNLLTEIFTVELPLLLFRGQPNDDPLIPKIAREEEKKLSYQIHKDPEFKKVKWGNIQKKEKHILDEFKRRAHTYLKTIPNNNWDWLALAQHFGLRTRLLDWTENSLAALWFAVNQCSEEQRPVVYAFIVPNKDIVIPEKDKNPFAGTSTKVFKPNQISTRIAAQSGWFTVHKFIERYVQKYNGFLPLERIRKYKEYLVKISIDPVWTDKIKAELNICGINCASLFPDMDGIAKYLNWFYIEQWEGI